MISGSRITFLVGGSIAAYKSAYLVSHLSKEGARVFVGMTENAAQFVTPLTFQTLSGNRVVTSLFDESAELSIGHLAMANQADVVVVAPATANIIAKMAAGIADDLVSSVLLATRAPVLFAPAMNVNMWENAVTQENVEKLKKRGVLFIQPESGLLACGVIGNGRLADADSILHGIEYLLTNKDLRGSRVIVTSGTTWEPIDSSRFIATRASGRMGFAIAKAAQLRGADVSLVGGPSSLQAPYGVAFFPVNTAKEMHEKVMQLATEKQEKAEGQSGRVQFIFNAAFATNLRPLNASPTRLDLKPDSVANIEISPVCDITQEVGESRARIEAASGCKLKLIGFTSGFGKEEVLIRQARERLAQTKADLMVGNFAPPGKEGETARLWIMDLTGRQEELASPDRDYIATRIISATQRG